MFAGQSVHKSTGTSDPEIADQIANELSRIVLEENPDIATKRVKGQATVEVPAPRKLGDPENIDNWTMEDAVQYRIENEPDMASSVRYHLEKAMRSIYIGCRIALYRSDLLIGLSWMLICWTSTPSIDGQKSKSAMAGSAKVLPRTGR